MRYQVARKKMVEEQLVSRGIKDVRVLDVMRRIPRHEFVDPGMASQACLDHPLNIGCRQTISQPYMVALMTEALGLQGQEKVLEIGTGSGYQTAVLAELCRKVFSVERITTLSNRARQTLYRLGYVNVALRIGDGSLGWSQEAPFDAVLVTAAAPRVPLSLLEQIGEGGRLVIPRGDEASQFLVRVRKRGGSFQEEVLTECRFVKLYGEQGWQED